ncbi:OB-fold nucleic acid binding domain-containing protein [Haloferax sp. YSSS75]|uniref:OB-fold nucleic acid binding domain-containing protein n=1 Tax=Haloferax sp. YSSS75 TaxID=3388564 RepID=UPI00398CFCAD
MESPTQSPTAFVRRQAGRLGRTFVARRSARRVRHLVTSTPRRRVTDLTGVVRATLVGCVADVAGEGPAVETWRRGDQRGHAVRGRATRPFVLDDDTGRISVRVPPDGDVVVGDEFRRQRGRSVLERGDCVAVTGRVVRTREWRVGGVPETDEPGGRLTLTGPAFALLAPP